MQAEPDLQKKPDVQKEPDAIKETAMKTEPGRMIEAASESKDIEVTPRLQDKWDMLVMENALHTYENDGVKYVKIGPENLNALPRQYQLLHKNSFLLHGFYRYRYLIIGKEDKENGMHSEAQYIIGVPGTNQRNEKMMADMFGFSQYLKTPKEDVEGYWCQKISL